MDNAFVKRGKVMDLAKRFFYNGNINKGAVVLTGEEYNHLANTMRAKVGDAVTLFNGDGFDYDGVINLIDKKSIILDVTDIEKNLNETRIDMTLFQAVTKTDKFELITQKMTELGLKRIVPVMTEYCSAKQESVRVDRLNKIAIEACKQCGRSEFLSVDRVISFRQMLDSFKEYELVIMPYEAEQNNSLTQAIDTGVERIALVIGSEGGFSAAEAAEAVKCPNVRIVTLGRRIMRAETAAVAAASAIMFALSEWERK